MRVHQAAERTDRDCAVTQGTPASHLGQTMQDLISAQYTGEHRAAHPSQPRAYYKCLDENAHRKNEACSTRFIRREFEMSAPSRWRVTTHCFLRAAIRDRLRSPCRPTCMCISGFEISCTTHWRQGRMTSTHYVV